ncbi:MAG: AAA family ATPase [Clostridia bacterium]|nr:AAA family ATPase [Clostridia bacterium]
MDAFDKVIGYEGIKAELKKLCDIMVNCEKYKKLGVATPRGLLLHGEPGVGKTLMADCLIRASGRKAFICRKDKPDGDFVKELKRIFDEAKAEAPSVVFLDDMDKFANEDGDHPNAEEYVTVQACIDDCRGYEVFVLATANDLDSLPDSLLRAGRFDKIIKVETPNSRDAEGIVGYYLSTKNFVGDIDAIEIASILDGKSCAELETVINHAGLLAGYAGKEKIEMEDMIQACLSVLFNACEVPVTAEVLERVAYHQAGHVALSELMQSESITLVSVCGESGDDYRDDYDEKGITIYCRNSDYFYNKKYMDTRIISLLGGKAATEIKYGDTDVCCNDDITRVFAIAQRYTDWYCANSFDSRKKVYNNSDDLLDRSEMNTVFL